MEPKTTNFLLFNACALSAGLLLNSVAVGRPRPAEAAATMPVAQQNKIVQQYCAVCHSDASPHGGLSFSHFDAAHPDPTVTALMIGQLTGLAFERVDACVRGIGTGCSPVLDTIRGGGALNAASTVMKDMKRPDDATTTAFISAIAAESAGAQKWTSFINTDAAAAQPPGLTAVAVREVPAPSTNGPEDVGLYRLALVCNQDTHEGEMKLSWGPAPAPKDSTLSVAVDGTAPVNYKAQDGEQMFPGIPKDSGAGSFLLYETEKNSKVPNYATPLPARTLTVSNMFPNQTATFSFDYMLPALREKLSLCFGPTASKN